MTGIGYRKPWNAEDDGFTTQEKADIVRHRQGWIFPVWRSLPFAVKAGRDGEAYPECRK